jgi:ATP-dependent DNA helicase RecQ
MDDDGNTLPYMDPISEIASRDFGVDYLYPIQRFVVSNILEGRHQIVVLPTGSGKSLCFQLPSRVLAGPTLVIMPLLSLIADQERKLSETDIPVHVLKGGLSPHEKDEMLRGIRERGPCIVLATPEACLVPATLTALAGCRISHLVIDEAHCVSEWGETFRPSYLDLGCLADRIGAPLITAFTATASERVIEKVKAVLFAGRDVHVVAASPDRPNISYRVDRAVSRLHAVTRLLGELSGPTIVFCRTRKGTELLARTLSRRMGERPIRFYHAGLSKEERAGVEKWFLPSRDGILCATSAYGMGVDKPDIRAVIHADVPPSIEAYLQETGRAGRDGAHADAALVFSREDTLFRSSLSSPMERNRHEAMLGYAGSRGECRRARLLGLIGQEAPACSGCDVCAGVSRAQPEGRQEILSFVGRHKRRFTAAQAAEVLKGSQSPRVVRGFLDRVHGFGLLSSWDEADIEEAIEAMVSSGDLKRIGWGPWEGKLSWNHSHQEDTCRQT